jgi:hypothetical protein
VKYLEERRMSSTMKKVLILAVGLLAFAVALVGFVSFWNSESTLAEVRERGANAPLARYAGQPEPAD